MTLRLKLFLCFFNYSLNCMIKAMILICYLSSSMCNITLFPKIFCFEYRPYAYDVTEGRPRALGVKRGTATCAIAKHAARGPTPACHTAGLARARALTERLSANALCQHNTCAQHDKS